MTATRAIHDVWFQYNDVNSRYNPEVEIDPLTLYLPVLRGYGTMADTPIAATTDATLKTLLTDIYTKSLSQLFTDDSTAMDDVRAIMYRWAGVDGLTGDERGPNIDARELGFLEALMGQDFRQTGSAGQSDPGFLAGQDLQEAFHIAHQNIFARLAAQSIGAELFEGDFYYNIATDSFEGITGLNESTIDALETLGLGATYADVFWANVVRVPRDFAPTRRAGAPQARRREAQGRNTYNVLPFRRAARAANDNRDVRTANVRRVAA